MKFETSFIVITTLTKFATSHEDILSRRLPLMTRSKTKLKQPSLWFPEFNNGGARRSKTGRTLPIQRNKTTKINNISHILLHHSISKPKRNIAVKINLKVLKESDKLTRRKCGCLYLFLQKRAVGALNQCSKKKAYIYIFNNNPTHKQ